jgi:serine/threonine protein phosphatase PrpC
MQNTFSKEKLSQNSPNLDIFIKEIFIKTNQDIQKEVKSSVNFSGSTCISVIYTDKKLICANIGDSRAVMGRCTDKGKIKLNKNKKF